MSFALNTFVLKCLWTHVNVNPWPQLQLTPLLLHLPEVGGRHDPKCPEVHGTVPSTESTSRGLNATLGQKTAGSLLCQGPFQEQGLRMEIRGSRRLGSLAATGCKARHQHGCCNSHGFPPSQPGLTWPLMSGFAPMAVCSSFTSLVGPVISEVPVSTMASQPPLHRVSPLATSTLERESRQKTTLRGLPAKAVGSSKHTVEGS